MSGADRLEDGFPHGTVDGYQQGCRGGWCPAGNEHGLSCTRAKQLSAGDYRFQRLVKQGLGPFEIALELGLAPETHTAPPRKVVVDDVDEVDDLEGDEEPMGVKVNATPADVAGVKGPAKLSGNFETFVKPRSGPSQAEVRAWAHEHGVDVNPRGAIRTDVMQAYRDAHAGPGPVEASPVSVAPKRPRENPVAPLPTPESTGTPPATVTIPVSAEEDAAWEEYTQTHPETSETPKPDRENPEPDWQARAVTAETALGTALRAWDAERARRRGQSVLFRSMASQVVLAEQERRDDGDLIAGMDAALREAQATIEDLRVQLAAARAGRSWWRSGS